MNTIFSQGPGLSLDGEDVRRLADLARRAGYSVDALASASGLSRRSLERWFHNRLQCSPREWLAKLRVGDAAQLLERGYSVKEAAHMVGFEFPTSLIKPFLAVLGCSPREYSRPHARRFAAIAPAPVVFA